MTEEETWKKAASILEHYYFAIAAATTYEDRAKLLDELHREYHLKAKLVKKE